MKDLFGLAAAGLLGVLLIGCAGSEQPQVVSAQVAETPVLYGWISEGLSGRTSVVIDLRTQQADVYIGGTRAGWAVVATGREGFDTPAGNYKVLEKVVDKHSTLYGIIVDAYGETVNGNADVRKDPVPPGGRFIPAPMPYWMRLTWYGIGMHAGPIPQPGRPASHGCIRLPPEFAQQLYQLVRIGTPVRIIR